MKKPTFQEVATVFDNHRVLILRTIRTHPLDKQAEGESDAYEITRQRLRDMGMDDLIDWSAAPKTKETQT